MRTKSLDGLRIAFHQNYWDNVVEDLFSIKKEFQRDGKMLWVPRPLAWVRPNLLAQDLETNLGLVPPALLGCLFCPRFHIYLANLLSFIAVIVREPDTGRSLPTGSEREWHGQQRSQPMGRTEPASTGSKEVGLPIVPRKFRNLQVQFGGRRASTQQEKWNE
ncbi:hypothetical protein NE237_021326 [Protea cynaroides]|uniref:Uncharacterized protein n=1 Tax=Protea cynaroides TaxID=273540 RepID=A0A9Q0H7N0_9MAGN|nr:hypothetical protein NE237_021326 [Protea cynaroides]